MAIVLCTAFCGTSLGAPVKSVEDSVGVAVAHSLDAIYGVNEGERHFAISTNAVEWGMTVMNMAPHMQVGRKWTVSLPVAWCPWFVSHRRAVRVLALQPEARYWFGKGWRGHFAGLHLSCAWYNVRWGQYRYQDHGQPALGAGLTYGYALPLKGPWNVEFTVGAGYLWLKYDRFYNVENGAAADTRRTSWFGPDHLGVSLSYTFDL